MAVGQALRVAAGTGPAAGVNVGIEVGESPGSAVGSSLTTDSAVAAGVDVRTGFLGAADSSSPLPQLVATIPPTINIMSKNEPDRMGRIITCPAGTGGWSEDELAKLDESLHGDCKGPSFRVGPAGLN